MTNLLVFVNTDIDCNFFFKIKRRQFFEYYTYDTISLFYISSTINHCIFFILTVPLPKRSCFSIFQAILASAFAKKDYDKAEAAASRVLQVLSPMSSYLFNFLPSKIWYRVIPEGLYVF